MPQAILLVAVPALLAFAAASDLFSMTISNRIPIALAAGFAIAAVWIGMDATAIGWHLAAGGLVLLLGFALFAARTIGGGDAKLAAAIALWLGFPELMPWAMGTAIIGGLLALALLVLRGMPLPDVLARQDWMRRLHDPTSGVPYGVALSFAALAVLPQTTWFDTLVT